MGKRIKEFMGRIKMGIRYRENCKLPVRILFSLLLLYLGINFLVNLNLFQNIRGTLEAHHIPLLPPIREDLNEWILQHSFFQLFFLFVLGLILLVFYFYYLSAEQRANMDRMTKLCNREYFTNRVEQKLRKLRSERALFIMMDVDYFKTINDTYGHGVGDQVLIQIAEILKRNFSELALVGRMGGDEFAIFSDAPGIEEKISEITAEIQREVGEISLPDSRVPKVACSMGIAFREQEKFFSELYEKADQLLYQKKASRRNRKDDEA